uniref:Uncharacterized protein n=1 Tax=Octopus bimaculoides TaxID=37653 RepID=A0A0L8GIE7_OCTBM
MVFLFVHPREGRRMLSTKRTPMITTATSTAPISTPQFFHRLASPPPGQT